MLILYLYKINIWLTIIGSSNLIYFFVKISCNFFNFANNL